MTPTALDQLIRPLRIEKAFECIAAQKYEDAEKELSQGLEEALQKKDPVMQVLFYSALGVLYKLKKDPKTSWRFYEKAEKILPDHPALKLISVRLLIEVFGQYDTAIQKIKKILKNIGEDPPLRHQAHSILGLAYLKKSDKKKALEFLNEAMSNNFKGLITARNIDLKLLEALMKKNVGKEDCKTYLEKALVFAQHNRESREAHLFSELLKHFPS